MNRILSGLSRPLMTLLVAPVAAVLLLVLFVLAVAWFYVSTLIYLGCGLLTWLRPITTLPISFQSGLGMRSAR
jgi:hypothetical protein